MSLVQPLLAWFAVLLYVVLFCSQPSSALGGHQMARRTPGEFDSLLSELKSKAMTGRMRFGKRSSRLTFGSDFNLDPDMYSPDRYLWLQ